MNTVDEAREASLPEDVLAALAAHGITARDEAPLRRELERHTPGYTLYRLTPAAARRWKCHYRIMLSETYLDCQTAAEAYARALLAVLAQKPSDVRPEPPAITP